MGIWKYPGYGSSGVGSGGMNSSTLGAAVIVIDEDLVTFEDEAGSLGSTTGAASERQWLIRL